jgi:hypothetical protein
MEQLSNYKFQTTKVDAQERMQKGKSIHHRGHGGHREEGERAIIKYQIPKTKVAAQEKMLKRAFTAEIAKHAEEQCRSKRCFDHNVDWDGVPYRKKLT